MGFKYPSKGYLHFDKITSFNKKVEKYVCDFSNNPTHSFLPLIYDKLVFDRFVDLECKNDNNESSINYKERTVKYLLKKKKVPVVEKPRPIMYASHIDNFIYKHYGLELNKLYNQYVKNEKFDNSVIAYRDNKKGKNNVHFAAEVINFIAENPNCYVYVGDYKGFFDSLNHCHLKNAINTIYGERMPKHQFKIYQSLTNYAYIHKEDIHLNLNIEQDKELLKKGYRSYFNNFQEFREFKKQDSLIENQEKVLQKNNEIMGIPQGTAISAIYSNIYMIEIDKYISNLTDNHNGMYRRYSDDFIVILPNIDLHTLNKFKVNIEKKIQNAKLTIHPSKTQVMQFTNNKLIKLDTQKDTTLDYLGFVFDGKIVKMREKSIYKYYRTAYKLIKKGEIISRKKGFIGDNTRLTYKRKLYQKYHQLGERSDIKYNYKERKYGTFITYANKSKKIFDKLSPYTNNMMKEQIKNHQKNINKKIYQATDRLKKRYPFI